jgi:hypothetical protein
MSSDVAASVRARLLNQARQHGEKFERTLARFAGERLLFRLDASAARNRCILKGASLLAVEKAAGVVAERMDEILRSHCIAPADLRADRFWESYAARAEALLRRIEAATGRTITREPELFRAGVVAEAYDEGPEKWDAEEPLEEVGS